MLSFFRKYQKFLFLFVTIIIVTSFVFFGAFQAITPMFESKETTLYKTSDGKAITQSYLNDMSRFLAQEPLSMRGFYNFFNDNVISREFLDSGIGYLLTQENRDQIHDEWNEKGKKEKAYRLYAHPGSDELSVENIWINFAKPLHSAYYQHIHTSSFLGKEGYDSRVNLFLMERRFPGDVLSYILRQYEKQSKELGQDPKLNDTMALFGYRDLNDWFGKTFVENASKAVIQGAAFARNQGYRVSKEEISAELLAKANQAYQGIKEQTNKWPNAKALYYDCLRMLQMEEGRLMAIMEDVLLFRRIFQDVSGLNLVDTFSLKKFYEKAHECVEIEVVTLPKEYSFQKNDDLKQFEVYLEAVASPRSEVLALPDALDPIDVISIRAPDLVASVFSVEIAHVSKKDCEAKVTLKETWTWQERNESVLKKAFPDMVSLDLLSNAKRAEVDAFTRKRIVEEHLEWIPEALASKKFEEKQIVLPKMSFVGINDPKAFADMLAKNDALPLYTQDDENYYSVVIKARLKTELLTYKEACDLHILEKMAQAKDEKSLDRIYEAIFAYAKQNGLVSQFSRDQLAALRFAKYMNEVKADVHAEKPLWPLVKKKESVFRHSSSVVSFEEALITEGKALALSETVGPYFTRFVDRRIENPLPLDKMMMEEKFLSDEVKGQLLMKILSSSQSNG